MKDRFGDGFLAGVIAGAIMDFGNALSYYGLHFAKQRFADLMSVFFFGHYPANGIELVFADFLHLIWTGLLGTLACLLIPLVGKKGLLIRGSSYSLALFFLTYGLYRIPRFFIYPWQTAFSNFFTSFLFGVPLGYLLDRYERRRTPS